MEHLNEYRKSSYVIPVCLDKKGGKYMLVHGYTGALDLVPEAVAFLFDEMQKNEPLPNSLSEDVRKILLQMVVIYVVHIVLRILFPIRGRIGVNRL